MKGVELRDYQKDGVNWILNRYDRALSTILGDGMWVITIALAYASEMGLGKTVQSITVMTHLLRAKKVSPPFSMDRLIIFPPYLL